MKNDTSKQSSGISTERDGLNFFSDPASVEEVRRLLDFSITRGAVRTRRSCSMWTPVIPDQDQTTKRSN